MSDGFVPVGEALKKLRALKKTPVLTTGPRDVTEPERLVKLGQRESDGSLLSSEDPEMEGATDFGAAGAIEATRDGVVPTPPANSGPQVVAAGVSGGVWLGVGAIVVAALTVWLSVTAYLHGDTKSDIRELRADVRQSAADLRQEMGGVDRRLDALERAPLVPDKRPR